MASSAPGGSGALGRGLSRVLGLAGIALSSTNVEGGGAPAPPGSGRCGNARGYAPRMADLDAAAVACFAETLRELREELRALLRSSADGAKPVSLDQSAVGRLSRMDALQRQAMAQANRQQVQVRLRRCEAALEAIERDEYGLCRRCEEPIAIARLEAMPEAPFCVECQQGRS